MKRLMLGLTLLLAVLPARATNITNYLQIVVAGPNQLILLSDIGARTNFNITVSNLTVQIALNVQTNNNTFSGTNTFTGPLTVANGNPDTVLWNLWIAGALNFSNAPASSGPATPGTISKWEPQTNNGVLYWRPLYQ